MEFVKGFEVVEKFLDDWKQRCTDWYIEQNEAYLKAKEERKTNPHEASEKKEAFLDARYERHAERNDLWKIPRMYGRFDYEGRDNAIVHVLNEEYAKFQDRWSHVLKMRDRVGRKYRTYEEVVEAVLQDEYERKYTKLVTDCQSITGDVLEADLKIGPTGNIEGFIVGSKGKAEIWSTLSGGEVQCCHFRFYCHKR